LEHQRSGQLSKQAVDGLWAGLELLRMARQGKGSQRNLSSEPSPMSPERAQEVADEMARNACLPRRRA
jgi:hypothetical protein